MPLDPGIKLGPYEILALLGAGGMGEVYRARDTRLDRDVAIKVLPESMARDPERVARFEREAKAVAAVSHPHVIEIYSFGVESGAPYLVMEFLRGEALRKQIDRGRMAWMRAVRLTASIAEGLAAAHDQGVIHRDLKPENIILTDDGIVKILDFGLARRLKAARPQSDSTVTLETEPGAVLGTIAYMSPEQLRGLELDARTDVFALGSILFELISGERPFQGESGADIMAAILKADPPKLSGLCNDIPEELATIVDRCLKKQAGRRFQSSRDLAFALRRLDHDPAVRRDAHRVHEASIAVLPFTNLGGSVEDEYFSDGVTEEIINALSRVEGLRVAARTSVFAFKGKPIDISEVRRKLNVAVVLEGTVRRQGRRVRLAVQLVNASDGFHMWSERFDRQVEDLFSVQDEIAAFIAGKLANTFGKMPRQERKAPTDNLDAYDAYLKGRHFRRSYGADFLRALPHFERAIELDPDFAIAYAGLAETYTSLGFMATLPPREAMPKARLAAERALSRDTNVAEAHCALGSVQMFYDRDWSGAERSFRRAIALNPNDSYCLYQLGHPYHAFVSHDLDAGIRLCRNAVDCDPLAAWPRHGLIANLMIVGRMEEALAAADEAVTLNPGAFNFERLQGLLHLGIGEGGRAVELLESAARKAGRHPWSLCALAAAHVACGRRAEADEIHQELAARSHTSYVQPAIRAMLAGWLGNFDEAFELLELAFEERDWTSIALTSFPLATPLHSDDRFGTYLDRLGLVPYRSGAVADYPRGAADG